MHHQLGEGRALSAVAYGRGRSAAAQEARGIAARVVVRALAACRTRISTQ